MRPSPKKNVKSNYFYFVVALFLMMTISFFHTKNQLLPTTLFYYARHIPMEQAVKFQQVVVEPENMSVDELAYLKKKGITVYAYLSIGETGNNRSWINKIDKSWVLGKNDHWQSLVMDMTHPDWHNFLINYRAKTLWQTGYQGFFLDTMDSYQLVTATESKSALAQRQGVIEIIKNINQQFPGVHLLFNRGFEVLDEVADLADGVVAESLFAGWNPKTATYTDIKTSDHQWLLNKLTTIHDKYNLPIIVIDYLPLNQQKKGKEIARKILSLGFVPWISTVGLDQKGIGISNLNN